MTSGVVAFDAEDDWANSINESWGLGVQSFIETGRRIAKAKADLEHGRFLEMVRSQLPFSVRTADRLMAIAAHPIIGNWSPGTNLVVENGHNVSNLPASWGTLYELTRWAEPELKLAIGNRLIAGDTRRVDLKDIRTRVRKVLRGHAPAPDKHRVKRAVIEPLQFVARLRRHLGPEQIESLNSLDERFAEDLCMEISQIIYSKLEA